MGLLANLLGKPGKGTVEVPGYRDRTPQRSAVVRQCAGLLLSYPSPELVAQLPLLEMSLIHI